MGYIIGKNYEESLIIRSKKTITSWKSSRNMKKE